MRTYADVCSALLRFRALLGVENLQLLGGGLQNACGGGGGHALGGGARRIQDADYASLAARLWQVLDEEEVQVLFFFNSFFRCRSRRQALFVEL
jgi:hypothetical protein